VSSFVTDTHALLWHLSDDPALSTAARDIFQLADVVPDMPDRIIAATALLLGLPLLARDRRIGQLTSIHSLW
jgi:PIN domain nuclease of toxin-antitoxin system